MKRLSEEQKQAWDEEGYLVLEDVLTPDDVAELQQACDESLARWAAELEAGANAGPGLFDPGVAPDGSPYPRRLRSPHLHHDLFARWIREAAILDIVEDLIGPHIRLYGSKLNLKLAGGGPDAVEWHQDVAFAPHTNDRFLAVGIPLDAMTAENGPLCVIPGSNRWPVLDHHVDGYFRGAINHRDFTEELRGQVPLHVPLGGITVHHTRTLHGSAPNRSAVHRRLWLINYRAADAWPLLGCGTPGDDHACPGAEYDDYLSMMVRGEHQHAVLEPGEMRIPLPGRGSGATIYGTQVGLGSSYFSEVGEGR